jgi:hypothetical protein
MERDPAGERHGGHAPFSRRAAQRDRQDRRGDPEDVAAILEEEAHDPQVIEGFLPPLLQLGHE